MDKFFLKYEGRGVNLTPLPIPSPEKTSLKKPSLIRLNHGFIEENNPSEKVVIVEEELNGVDIDDIENLENLPRFLLIMHEECGNLKLVIDGGELTRNINQKKKSDISQ